MVEKQVNVQLKSGLQARQAALFVQEANRYNSDVYLEKEEKKVNAKSIMGIMSLAISKGTDVIISADGSDEESAVEALSALIEKEA
ncbi:MULTISPECIES: HPr family phosphocarrier protein [Planococcaceae]|uniref:HPr family phosphocarrier protein n=1 Tax=Planococcus halotolerans TaxID=2233542 RepID=A0A365KNF6_9BACL|nr:MULTISPECIES: HPr family phosphocarrier protein [Planococcaceae]QHJ71864.1 HPr family phosphocarrier protein [Planococcus halotolerans]RAZ74625.1 HPr family phosphocarrier protein [Planococcus halotolerans]RLQ85104.1 HPr family phosphocarrier protein [Planomicrobium sp. Y74]